MHSGKTGNLSCRLFRVSSWNSGMRCMSFYILIVNKIWIHYTPTSMYATRALLWFQQGHFDSKIYASHVSMQHPWRVCVNWLTVPGRHISTTTIKQSIMKPWTHIGTFSNMFLFKSQHGWVISSSIMLDVKLLIHSQASTVPVLKLGNGWIISSHALLGM